MGSQAACPAVLVNEAGGAVSLGGFQPAPRVPDGEVAVDGAGAAMKPGG